MKEMRLHRLFENSALKPSINFNKKRGLWIKSEKREKYF